MKEQLELLWELQKIDLELRSIKEERDRFPKEIKKLDEKENLEREKVQKEKEKIELLEKERRKKENLLLMEQEKIKKAQGKMFEIKTNREYQALLNEIETMKEANSRVEEEILQVMDEIDELKKRLSKREKELAITIEKIEGEKKRIQEKIAKDDLILKQHLERREAISKQLDSTLFNLYNILMEKRQGLSVVSVKNETCQGCFVHIPPQMYIQVQRNNEIIRCPNCNRILYWDGNGKTK